MFADRRPSDIAKWIWAIIINYLLEYVWKPADHLQESIFGIKTPSKRRWRKLFFPIGYLFIFMLALLLTFIAAIAVRQRTARGFIQLSRFACTSRNSRAGVESKKKVSRLKRYLKFFFVVSTAFSWPCHVRYTDESWEDKWGDLCEGPSLAATAAVSSPVGISFHMLISLVLLCFHSHLRVFHFFTTASAMRTWHWDIGVEFTHNIELSSWGWCHCRRRRRLGSIWNLYDRVVRLRLNWEISFFPASRRRSAFISSLILLHNIIFLPALIAVEVFLSVFNAVRCVCEKKMKLNINRRRIKQQNTTRI